MISYGVNSRSGACLELFAEKHIGHYAKKGAGQSLRAALQASSKAKKLKKPKKERKAEVPIHDEETDELILNNDPKSVHEEENDSTHSSQCSNVVEHEVPKEWNEAFQEQVNTIMTLYEI